MKKKYVISIVVICLLVASIVFFMKHNNSSTAANNPTTVNTTKDKNNTKDKKVVKDPEGSDKKTNENKKALEKKQNEEKEAAKKVADVSDDKAKSRIKELLSTLYFGKGSYSDYKKMFVFTDRVMSEDKFTAYRKDAKKHLKSGFGKEYSNVDEMMSSLSIKHEKNAAVVSFKDSKGEEKVRWNVVEKQGGLYIYNALLK